MSKPNPLIERTRVWLLEKAFPLWFDTGLDRAHGGFFECLSMTGEPIPDPKRTMVQARQIYCCHLATEMSGGNVERAGAAANSAIDFLLRRCSGTNGEFVHAVTREGIAHKTNPDLYAQGFALFGLAHAYAMKKDDALKTRAKLLVDYLHAERALPGGGFSEIQDGRELYEANPHMHLFEAAVTWMEIDHDPRFRALAEQVLEVCLTRLIEPSTGLLAEHFGAEWKREARYVWEPGHHFEWVWLLGRYERAAGANLRAVRWKLYDLADKHGVNRDTGMTVDEVWNDLTVKSSTSRFWPQCERVKAALQIGVEDSTRAPAAAAAADQAMTSLFEFLDVPHAGLWFDTKLESGEFKTQPAKASSLYHIAGAMAEYLRHRQELTT